MPARPGAPRRFPDTPLIPRTQAVQPQEINVSNLWPELLRITLHPDQISLERGRIVISLKGIDQRYGPPELIPVQPRHEPSLWAAPLDVLAIALDGLPEERRYDVHVVLSNHFSSYPLAETGTDSFPSLPGQEVDSGLEAALFHLLAQHDCRLASLQTRIQALATHHPDELQGEPGWLVLVEEGLACLGLIEDGEFTRLRSLYMWPASSVELLGVLDRQARLAGFERPPRTLLLWTRDEQDEVALPANSGWQVLRLGRKPLVQPSRAFARDAFPVEVRA